MKNSTRRILMCGLAACSLFALYPPWLYTVHVTRQYAGTSIAQKPAGYAFVFDPPSPQSNEPGFGVALDISRLAVEWLAVAGLTGFVLLLFTRKNLRGPSRDIPSGETTNGAPPLRKPSHQFNFETLLDRSADFLENFFAKLIFRRP